MYSWKGPVFSILTHFKSFLFYSHCLSVFFFSSSSGCGWFVCLCLSCLFAGFIAQRQQTKLTSLNNNCCASLHVSFLSPELQSLWTISSSDQELWLAMGPGFTHKHSSFTLLSPFVTLIINFEISDVQHRKPEVNDYFANFRLQPQQELLICDAG